MSVPLEQDQRAGSAFVAPAPLACWRRWAELLFRTSVPPRAVQANIGSWLASPRQQLSPERSLPFPPRLDQPNEPPILSGHGTGKRDLA
eukprot:365096-Chlamydomonas_euryale.AAC.9